MFDVPTPVYSTAPSVVYLSIKPTISASLALLTTTQSVLPSPFLTSTPSMSHHMSTSPPSFKPTINLSNHPTEKFSFDPTLLPSINPSLIGSQPPRILQPDSSNTPILNTPSTKPTHQCSDDSNCIHDNPCSDNICNEEGKCVLLESWLVPVEVNISLDRYPGETSWILENVCSGEIVASSVIHQ